MFIRIITFPFRYLFARLKKSIGKLDTLKIEPLYAFGNEKEMFFKARVVESYRQSRPSANKNYFQNLLAAIRRYAGSSVPNAKVEVSYHLQNIILESDAEGIISCTFKHAVETIPENDFIICHLLPEEGVRPERDHVKSQVLRYHSRHPIGIISDIDDTVLISHATMIGKKFWLSISKNAYTRRPFPGVSEFYKALSDNNTNPFFYVSSSDWNLYDLIRDFLNYRDIPAGPLLLKDLHVDLRNIWKSGGGSHQHKLEKINMILELYPGMKFILIGDSGQHDPELYAEIIEKHPGQIKAVYIREIRIIKDQRRKLLEAKLRDPAGPGIVFVKNTEQAIQHARNHGII
ncbi:MAG: DUF2183 domain-containing protein [Bacteroidales bacterium]|nr:DUF2183 domain-containing protein [Bacteroidales bacterium]